MNDNYALTDSINSDDIRKFRRINNLSRKELSSFLDVSVKTIEKWENSDNDINGPIVFLINILFDNPELIDKYRLPEKKYPIRLFYMSSNKINTVIDVDILKRKVSFKNYTDNLLLRAFGNKESVSYEDFEDFLESRCFPKSRDKLKIELEHYDVKSYDPLSIIRKTKGKLVEDDCYILIEGVDYD